MTETKLKNPEVESFIEKILAEAKKKADEIVEQAKNEAVETIKAQEEEARKKARQEIQKQIDFAKTDAERMRINIVSEAKVKSSWIVPSMKDQLIQQVFDSVKEKMESLADKPGYTGYIERIITEGAEAIGGGEIIIVLNERDSKLKLDLKKISQNITRDLGTNTTVKLSPDSIHCIGGVMVKTADEKIAVDNSIEGIIERVSREYRLKVTRELFANQ